MVHRHVGVRFTPQLPLDPVVVRTVWRQKVQPELLSELRQPQPGLPAAVDDEVVQHHVDHRLVRVLDQQLLQQVDEQPAGLPLALHPDRTVRRRVHRAGEIALHVLARRHA